MEVKSVLVTGGVGFLGSRVVQHIRAKYPRCLITVVDTRAYDGNADPNTKYVCVDITSAHSVTQLVDDVRPEAIVHVAGISPPLSERYARRIQDLVTKVNVDGTRNMLRAAQMASVKAFVYTSSCTAVTDDVSQSYANIDERWPTVEPGTATMYGESKAQAEALVSAANMATNNTSIGPLLTCSLRPAIIFGEGDYALMPSIVSLITEKSESPYRLGDGLNMWDIVYVGNVADAHLLALENLVSDNPNAAGEVFFIQNNEPIAARDLMLFIWKEFNGHIPPFEIGIPTSLGWFVGLLGELYTWLSGKPATLSRGSVLDATAMRYASGEKARRILGYEPRVGLEHGLRLSCQDYAAKSRNETKIR